MNSAFQQLQSQLPILSTLEDLIHQSKAPFYAPGHKKGKKIPAPLAKLFGKSIFQADLPELPELDNLFAPESVILQAQKLASEVFQADQTWFLVNGSSCGIIASILAICQTGDQIILPRNCHQSAIAGLILAGAMPIFITPEYDSHQDMIGCITSEALEATLRAYPNVKGVMVVYPTYQGICGDLKRIADITHQYNIPLLVDEAHGAHFTFHEQLPPSALSAGADLSVQSTHKVLGAMTQASMLHLQGNRLDPRRLNQALQWLQTTSPSYLLLASLDAARQQMALEGKHLLGETLRLAQRSRRELSQIQGLSVIKFDNPKSGFQYLDPTRLTVDVTGLGLTGYQADEILDQELGVTAELPLLRHLTFIISIGNCSEDIDRLIGAFQILATDYQSSPLPFTSSFLDALPLSPLVLSPREATFSRTINRKLEESAGYISSEVICPYPPGIPVLMAGERITEAAIEFLRTLLQQGATITGCQDATLKTLKVVAET